MPAIGLKGEEVLHVSSAWEMEDKRSSSSSSSFSFVDEFFPLMESDSPSRSDILSSIFPRRSPVAVKHSERGRAHWNDDCNSVRLMGASGGSNHVSLCKSQDELEKSSDTNEPCDIAEPCLMSSSVYYGGRDDFNPGISTSYQHGSTYTNKDSEDGSNLDLANRGEWWQGSLYY